MRRPTARLFTGTALAVASLGLTAAGATTAYAGNDWDTDRSRDSDHSRDGRSWDSGHSRDSGDRSWDSERLELSPRTARPGTTVTVSTRACGHDGHGRGDARDLGAGEFRLDPRERKEVATGQFWVPDDVRPGTHSVHVRCDNGRQAHGELFVEHGGPRGHVRTGVGGSVAPDTPQIAAGVAVLAGAAAGGTWLLRRRASGAQGS
ncbi:hypothetical protein [Streptomyces sp. NPDC093109]|uniref:hypothetical protein n=1 Tax=Streptomyces sp. NPDC093109 TaxID=3154977 RepID=UPI00344B0FDE